ncbi:acidic leucine-rich nuclear phosphoprotein 32-related protein-like [Tasmannia lanceolata]|uniref:acidic leucine-rich nuclear phosphoprotein 32-related protein-like n=1 Tax=Tasmannia lanceolata TaxID=3420 RepID=UPI0040645DA2
MDEVWERAVETALDGQTDCSSVRTLTLDGAVKCLHGRLPPPGLLEKFHSLEHLSIANVGVSSLEKFPRLRNLQRLILSDNRIAGGLEFLVEAGLDSLRDLDLSNNRIQYIEDLAPLARLSMVSLDLYECPVTRIKDYRFLVFGLIRSLRYLDKMDADENERPESDEEEDEEDVEDDDPGSGEIDGEDRSGKLINGGSSGGVLDVDEDEESDADEEETETTRVGNGVNSNSALAHRSNGFRVAGSRDGDEEEEDVEDEDDEDEEEEIDEENGEDEDVVEVHEIDDSDEDEDGVEEEEDDDDDDEDGDEEDVEDEEEDVEPGSAGRLTSTEGEIDGHEQGEEDENGEIGEDEEQGVEEDGEYEEDDGEGEDEEEDFGSEYLMQPIAQAEEEAAGSDYVPGNEDDVEEEEEEVEDEEDLHSVQMQPKRKRGDGDEEDLHGVQMQPSSSQPKRKRDDGEDDGSIEDGKSSRPH